MAYKRYIKRGGKIYGPYVYHSRKENGKVISEYLGKHEGNSECLEASPKLRNSGRKIISKKLLAVFFVLGLVVIFALIFFIDYSMTGMITSTTYSQSGGNLVAYEKGGTLPISPSDYDNEASSGNYTNISTSDNGKWVTSGASGGQYDSQIYVFNLTESIARILALNILWEFRVRDPLS